MELGYCRTYLTKEAAHQPRQLSLQSHTALSRKRPIGTGKPDHPSALGTRKMDALHPDSQGYEAGDYVLGLWQMMLKKIQMPPKMPWFLFLEPSAFDIPE